MFELTYKLQEYGWATIQVSSDVASLEFAASYLSDPLKDLGSSARGLLRGMSEAFFDVIQEPGSHRFVVTRQNHDVFVQGFRFDRLFPSGHASGELVFSATCSLRSFVNTAINCLRHVRDTYSDEEYLKRWKARPFPNQELDDLLVLRQSYSA